jgi:hypothetical protein
MQVQVAALKTKGDLAEVMVAADLMRRGHKIAFPYGEDWDYDLIVCRGENLERVQVKYTESDGVVLDVQCRSRSISNGRIIRTKYYTAPDRGLDGRLRPYDQRLLLRPRSAPW